MLRPLLRYLRPYRLQLIPVVLATLLEMFFNAQIPLSVKFMIDKALVGHNERMMVVILGALAVSTIVVSLTSLGRDYLYAKIVGRIVSSVRQRMFEHLQRLSMEFYARTEAGDTVSRFSNDLNAVETGLAAGVSWGLQPLMDLVLSAILVFTLEWRLATLGILLCPLCVLGPRLLSKRATGASVTKQEEESRILSSLQETLMAPALVRAFNLQDTTIGRFRGRNQHLLGASVRLGFLTSLMERSASFGTLLLQVVVMGISGYLAFRGTITIGTFASFQALFVSLSYSFMYLAQYTPNLINASGGMIRIEELLAQRPGVEDAPAASALQPLRDAIVFDDVIFGYTNARRNLNGVNLRVPHGASVAFVGPSGSGKSTLLNLLGCLDRTTQGQYILGGQDVSRLGDDELSEIRSRYLGFIFQSYNLIAQLTVVENIELPLYYQGQISRDAKERCIQMAQMVGLADRLDHRPYQLSGGQQQRVAIARALVNDPHVILADEPTGNLDSATGEEIMQMLEALNAAGKTIIMVTHEPDIAARAHRTLRMRDGMLESHVANGALN